MSFLEQILASTRKGVAERKRATPLAELEGMVPVRADDRRFLKALRKPGMSVIAEYKRNSPSQDREDADADISEMVKAYQRGEASAISVLTEETEFHGSLADLKLARGACDLPILRKDFIVDRYQIVEAAVAEADAILLIAAAFVNEPSLLQAFHDAARDLCLDVLIEVRNKHELDLALGTTQDLVGINNRDLDTLEIDPDKTLSLVANIPSQTTVVSESGVKSASDIEKLVASTAVRATLIGTALMRADDPEEMCRRFSNVADNGFADRSRLAASVAA